MTDNGVYHFRNKRTGEVIYVGSSRQLKKRIQTHKNHCNNEMYDYIRQNGGYDAFEIVLVANPPKLQLLMEEQNEINKYNTFNKIRAYLTDEERKTYAKMYYEKNRERLNENKRLFYQMNREKILGRYRIWCKLNKERIKLYAKNYKETHKEQIVEQSRKYHQIHKKQIAEKSRLYHQTHKKQIAETKRLYWKNNPEKKKERDAKKRKSEKYKEREKKRSEKIVCSDCGGSYCKKTEKRHFATKKHTKAMNH